MNQQSPLAPAALYVLVKGDRHQAAAAASARGIPFAYLRTFATPTPQTAGNAPATYFDAVAAWFGEQPNAPPFPVGACLHFSVLSGTYAFTSRGPQPADGAPLTFNPDDCECNQCNPEEMP